MRASTPASGGAGQRINITPKENPYGFDPNTFSFQVGKAYTLQFSAPAEFHTFTVADLGIDYSIDPGKATEQKITFTRVGTFKLVCIPHQDIGMTGTVTITP